MEAAGRPWKARTAARKACVRLPQLPGQAGCKRRGSTMLMARALLCPAAPACLQGAHSVAYHGGLSRPLICPESSLATLNAEEVAEFYAENYTAPRMVLAAGACHRPCLLLPAAPAASAVPAFASAQAWHRCASGLHCQHVAAPSSAGPTRLSRQQALHRPTQRSLLTPSLPPHLSFPPLQPAWSTLSW